ncbi:uncharacterized protein LOC110861517 [Folsomia candida]|uniref:WAP domain-containing protein n=1 Tax=Folsomia candida TaxID=158441 RepID=A0A226D067_FOLCA|nr:uncharacterized protein LOC110861517 [Folsomia candida]OXA38962.1 hypothetical protein Fcan01_26224 [Folsomia candida]
MKTITIFLAACVVLAAVVTENTASPVAQSSGGAAPGNGNQKPGSCYRPGSGRKRRSVDEDDDFQQDHLIEKRQVGSTGGSQGGNPWKPPAPTPRPTRPTQRPRPQCYNDYDCTANKKCCTGVCQTPAFVG